MHRDLNWLTRIAIAAVAAVLVAAAPSVTSAAPMPWQAEEAEERAEEAEESAEDATAFVVPQATQCSQRRTDALALRIAADKADIAKIRASKRFTRTLAHTTTRWLGHLPKKRAHLKALRKRVRALRAMQSAC